MTPLPPSDTFAPDHAHGRVAAFDLVLAVLAQDGQAVTAVIRHLRGTTDPGCCAYACERQLNSLLADALTDVGRLADGSAATAFLADRLSFRPGSLRYPPESRHAVAALALGDFAPLRRLHGTPGLLARAVAVVGLGLAVRSPHWFRGLLKADREELARVQHGRDPVRAGTGPVRYG